MARSEGVEVAQIRYRPPFIRRDMLSIGTNGAARPFVIKKTGASKARTQAAYASDAGMATSAPQPQRIVAIVDDDPGMRVSLSNLLGAHGFKTSVFSSAEEWLDRGATVRADCMLLDVQLGGISGVELQRQLRASGSRLPVIFISARDDEATRSHVLAVGGASFLSKPFVAAQLIGAIESATA